MTKSAETVASASHAHERENSPARWPSRLAVTLILLVLGSPIAWLYIATRPALPRRLMRQVQPGMTKTQVREILGEPNLVRDDGTWEYARWGNEGYVDVFFTSDGKVLDLNDESVFGADW